MVFTTKERATAILDKMTDAFKVTVESKADLMIGLDERTKAGKF